MRFLSFKILALCILLPPLLYIVSAYLLEGRLRDKYAGEIEGICTGDPQLLVDGSVRLKDAVNQNIDHYLQTKGLISLGIKVDVAVRTKRGKLLYPAIFEPEDASALPFEPMRVAAENYALMSEGLVIRVETRFEHFQLLSMLILAFYVFFSLLILYIHYRSAMREIRYADQEKSLQIDRLRDMERMNAGRLDALTRQREQLKSEFEQLKGVLEDERKKAERNEDDLIEEIEAFEAQLNQNRELQNVQKQQNAELIERIRQYEKGQPKIDKQKAKTSLAVRKRFNTLYKELTIHDRAISGYCELNQELKIKAEEIIHQLNQNPGLVTIKRKVFGRKGHQTVFEVIFGYKGRFYFRSTKDKRIEVLAIGTKNTQTRELEYLAKL